MNLKRIFLSISAAAAIAASAQAEEEKPAELPAWLAKTAAGLPQEKLDFLKSEKAETVAGSREKLNLALEGKTAEELEAYIDAVMSVIEASLYNPETDMDSIPLNTDSKRFNSWKVKLPKELGLKREPGLFTPSYYASPWNSGIRTFAGAPIAVYPEDLVAGNVQVAIVGAPLDMGSYHRGAKFGPLAMRSEYLSAGPDMFTMVDPTKELIIADYGDIAVDNMSTEITVQHVRERVREIAETGAVPFIVGGDHSLEYPNLAALADVHGKGEIGVVHFDSHFDAGTDQPHYITHGQPVYRAVKEGHVKGENYIQVGLRGPWPGEWGFEWMRNNGVRYHTMVEVEKKGWEAVMEQALKEARENGKKLYVSFDVDVLDPAFVPGTGTPVPGGLTMREAVPIVRRLCAENDLVGFEIVELAPVLDSTYRSALNANFIMHACLTGVAMRKVGITQPGYLSELTTEHQQPGAGKRAKKDGKAEEIDPFYGTVRGKDAAATNE